MTELNGQALENMEENDRSINGKISSMDLKIGPKKGDTLNYKIKLKISDVLDKEITFTLHRSLEIHNVKINASDINSFKRINDWIIFDKHPVGTVQVEFNVSGKLPVSLGEVTDRTLMLTQDSPWYPVLGKHKVLSPISDYGYLTNNLCGSEKYEINIISQRGDIITNLSPQKGAEFSGSSLGPLIIQGAYESEKIDGIHFVAPTAVFSFYKGAAKEISEELVKKEKEYTEKLGIDFKERKTRKYNQIFLVALPEQQLNLSDVKATGEDIFLHYPQWLYPKNFNDPAKSAKIKCDDIKNSLVYEHFWEKGFLDNSSIKSRYLEDLFYVIETGKIDYLKQAIEESEYNNTSEKIIYKNDINYISEIKKLINMKSEKEKKDAARKILNQWIENT